jgi:catechol 2,3-dioxygenase-like lactoylglutathione lyase family enzyme
MTIHATPGSLDRIEHIAISVADIDSAVSWYTSNFRCTVAYRDASWALLDFANLQLALVIPEQHPPHIALASPTAERFGKLTTHRDGTRSTYVNDPAGNSVEIMAAD